MDGITLCGILFSDYYYKCERFKKISMEIKNGFINNVAFLVYFEWNKVIYDIDYFVIINYNICVCTKVLLFCTLY